MNYNEIKELLADVRQHPIRTVTLLCVLVLVAGVFYYGVAFLTEKARQKAQTKSEKEQKGQMANVGKVVNEEIRFCTTLDGVRLAYAVVGTGYPIIKVANWLTHLKYELQSPVWHHWIEGLSRENLLVRYDERGCGLSDWQVDDLSFDAWVSDLEAVVDSLNLERFALLGLSQGAAVAIAYAVKHPGKITHLVLYGGYARGWAKRGDPDYEKRCRTLVSATKLWWGKDDPTFREMFTSIFVPEATAKERNWFNHLQRISTSPENAQKFIEEFGRIDVQHLLHRVKSKTLVLHCNDDRTAPFEEGCLMASQIPGAKLFRLKGTNHILLENDSAWPIFLSEVKKFVDS